VQPLGAEEVLEDPRRTRLPWNRSDLSISGRVTDESGQPIAHAQICTFATDWTLPRELEREPKCAMSRSDGSYGISGLPWILVEVIATAATFRPSHYDPPGKRDVVDLRSGQSAKQIDIVLRSGGVIVKGVVKDIAGGVIEGASVTARRRFVGSNLESSFGRSDDNGEFAIWATVGQLEVLASAYGYADGRKSGTAPGYTFELRMTPESVVAGRVVRADDGTPVADARVTVGSGRGSGGVTYTDADGHFRVDRLEPGRYKPSARTGESYGQIAESIGLGLGEVVDGLEISVHPMLALRGRIIVAGDVETPCERGSVSVTGRNTRYRHDVEVDEHGEVELAPLEPDTYEVSVTCEDFVAEANYPDVVLAEVTVERQIWRVRPGLVLRGVVVDEDGGPIARSSVSARPIDVAARAQQTHSSSERTDEHGRFALPGLIPGTYELNSYHEDYLRPETAPQVTLVAGETPEEPRIELEAGGVVTGRVIDANQRPVPGATVEAIGRAWGTGDGAMTGDDGTFTLRRIRPGRLRVVAQREWFNDMRTPGTTDDDVQGKFVEVEAGKTAHVELVVVEQFGTITGKVVDADGGPIADAFVQSTRESDSAAASGKGARASLRFGAWLRTPSLTEADGTFALDELEVGKHTVSAMRKGGGEGVVEHVETGSTGVVIRLSEGGSIAGKVVLASGAVPKRFSIDLEDRKQAVHRRDSFFQTEGRFTLSDLPAGTYTVAASAAEGSSEGQVELGEGAKKNGIQLVLAPKVDVTGTVVDLQTGAPVPGIKVMIGPRKGSGGFFVVPGDGTEDISDESGRFKVHATPVGAVRVYLLPSEVSSSDNTHYSWQRLTTTIPADVASHELQPIRIAKSRAKPGNRPVDFGFTFKEAEPDVEEDDVPLEIAIIRPGSSAADSDLKVGDVIVEVDGHDVTGENRYLYRSLTHVNPDEKVTFGVEGGGSVTLAAGESI